MDWQPYITGYIVRSVLSGLVILPALGVSALALRKLGAKHDPTRRWVDFTKAALGLWSISQLLILVCWIIYAIEYSQRQNGKGYFGPDYTTPYIYIVGSLLSTLGQLALLLAFFFLAHGLDQLRGSATTDGSRTFSVGSKVVFGGSALIALVEVAVFCCYIASQIMFKVLPGRDRYVRGDWDNAIRLSLAYEYMSASVNCMFLIAAVGMTIYAFQAQRKARGSPVQKAATLLLIAVSLWLVARIWGFITTVMSLAMVWWGSAYVGIIDTILAIWTTFAALMLLYTLASNDAYGLSRLHYQEEEDEGRVWEDRT